MSGPSPDSGPGGFGTGAADQRGYHQYNNTYYYAFHPPQTASGDRANTHANGATITTTTRNVAYTPPDVIPARRPVQVQGLDGGRPAAPAVITTTAAPAPSDPSTVSPILPDPPQQQHGYLHPTHSSMSSGSGGGGGGWGGQQPQRMGTVSSAGVFTVSPASSIHDGIDSDNNADEEAYGCSGNSTSISSTNSTGKRPGRH
ncbi:hypothetical protein VTJ49DRAFT_5340 [Mycothermus thermophilus]|uniref:Uncharacterized protein n=1 Tax=Humicola insolens TaxID=85995 RepID=A0ABR3V3A9_HUMIN